MTSGSWAPPLFAGLDDTSARAVVSLYVDTTSDASLTLPAGSVSVMLADSVPSARPATGALTAYGAPDDASVPVTLPGPPSLVTVSAMVSPSTRLPAAVTEVSVPSKVNVGAAGFAGLTVSSVLASGAAASEVLPTESVTVAAY